MKCLIIGKKSSGKTTKAQMIYKEYRNTSLKKHHVCLIVDDSSTQSSWILYGGIKANNIFSQSNMDTLLNKLLLLEKSKKDFYLIIDCNTYPHEVLAILKQILDRVVQDYHLHIIITVEKSENNPWKKIQNLPFDKTFEIRI